MAAKCCDAGEPTVCEKPARAAAGCSPTPSTDNPVPKWVRESAAVAACLLPPAPRGAPAARAAREWCAFYSPSQVRGIYHLLFLFWLFAAVAIVADVFMAAIETITSQKKTIIFEGHEFPRERCARVQNLLARSPPF